MKIRNVDFDFDIFRIADAERFQAAAEGMQAAEKAIPKDNLGAVLRGTCAMLDSFLADVLGEDYDTRLGLDVENLREMKAVYQEVLNAVTAAQKELEGFGMAQTVAGVDIKAQAAAAARQAAASLPQPAERAERPAPAALPFPAQTAAELAPQPQQAAPAPDFAQMNRAQRRAYLKAVKGGR